jgi:hypothetical protein
VDTLTHNLWKIAIVQCDEYFSEECGQYMIAREETRGLFIEDT